MNNFTTSSSPLANANFTQEIDCRTIWIGPFFTLYPIDSTLCFYTCADVERHSTVRYLQGGPSAASASATTHYIAGASASDASSYRDGLARLQIVSRLESPHSGTRTTGPGSLKDVHRSFGGIIATEILGREGVEWETETAILFPALAILLDPNSGCRRATLCKSTFKVSGESCVEAGCEGKISRGLEAGAPFAVGVSAHSFDSSLSVLTKLFLHLFPFFHALYTASSAVSINSNSACWCPSTSLPMACPYPEPKFGPRPPRSPLLPDLSVHRRRRRFGWERALIVCGELDITPSMKDLGERVERNGKRTITKGFEA
ncbi:hypothetical protein BT96DRAFT_1022510 [Gymnopus androsaceus JB14]|uniref:Uncharacterized protein n=1 Tax=Gymnopus androsaceus JB14 TaxID=1447944 RepID=A0A6A4H891_9AGAR|nr:hypothetical protein BT96DRAFT_1022510 [Gymnopus androsaceus JB14]